MPGCPDAPLKEEEELVRPKIRVNRELFERARDHAEAAGYSSVEELVAHLLEKEIEGEEASAESEELVEKRLKGLGYLS